MTNFKFEGCNALGGYQILAYYQAMGFFICFPSWKALVRFTLCSYVACYHCGIIALKQFSINYIINIKTDYLVKCP